MKCLRCGYCCQNLWVVVVDDPDKPISKQNLRVIGQNGPERCPHLRGNKPGEYSCAVHDRKWYKRTPCFKHGQIERSKDDVCRMGEYQMKGVV